MQADAIADQPGNQNVVLEELADPVHREDRKEAAQAVPLQRGRHDAELVFKELEGQYALVSEALQRERAATH